MHHGTTLRGSPRQDFPFKDATCALRSIPSENSKYSRLSFR